MHSAPGVCLAQRPGVCGPSPGPTSPETRRPATQPARRALPRRPGSTGCTRCSTAAPTSRGAGTGSTTSAPCPPSPLATSYQRWTPAWAPRLSLSCTSTWEGERGLLPQSGSLPAHTGSARRDGHAHACVHPTCRQSRPRRVVTRLTCLRPRACPCRLQQQVPNDTEIEVVNLSPDMVSLSTDSLYFTADDWDMPQYISISAGEPGGMAGGEGGMPGEAWLALHDGEGRVKPAMRRALVRPGPAQSPLPRFPPRSASICAGKHDSRVQPGAAVECHGRRRGDGAADQDDQVCGWPAAMRMNGVSLQRGFTLARLLCFSPPPTGLGHVV